MPFWKRGKQDIKKQHSWPVHHKMKTVDAAGRVHIPKSFLNKLSIKPGDPVQLNADWENELRVRAKASQSRQQPVHEKTVDTVGKLLLPKSLRNKYHINPGTRVEVSLYEGYNEIRIKKT